jgi:hypothetical protein
MWERFYAEVTWLPFGETAAKAGFISHMNKNQKLLRLDRPFISFHLAPVQASAIYRTAWFMYAQ